MTNAEPLVTLSALTSDVPSLVDFATLAPVDPAHCRCDLCGQGFTRPWMRMAHVTNFRRVNVCRYWHFCSATHRAAWWAQRDAEPYLPVADDPAHPEYLHPADMGPFEVTCVDYDGPGAHTHGVTILDGTTGRRVARWSKGRVALVQVFDTSELLNAWWQAPDVAPRMVVHEPVRVGVIP